MAQKITDYSGWTYSLPSQPQQKDWKQLQNKLKTYSESSKFLRQGSTIQQYDQKSGKLVRKPIYNVIHTINQDDKHGIKAQDLRDMIRQSVLTGDRQLMNDVSQYRYVTADKFVSQKQRQAQQDRIRRKRILITTLVLGGAGSLLGLVPLISHYKRGESFNKKIVKDSLLAGGLGMAGGIGLTGLIELLK